MACADVQQAIPAFLTVPLMPLTYSIAYGGIGGICNYVFLFQSLFVLDLIAAAVGRKGLSQVLADYTPAVFKERNKERTASPSARVNPEHATHHAAVEGEDEEQLCYKL
ncbi:hypothetical protein COO60DRAFT_1640176 [Scenedesmus sp. NREL 46B-D3]|nr:hypothetical protein COO60DRAFT_1640176 [Scenedesmus sp. NREL 46B-D3]